ncbi:hypothetical protein [Chitinophaga silvisoli]|uniref:HTTM-like domain-containing protein n=1 Tax=Chitinophaga silvisoli TaxID=2291814 RepID=A0A3E1NZ37_9BACT|nr:hypothetical protein [Chitinophaga silvisoli]RFM33124.1 hypothetical protein DXN04_19015 [Chitinophaga silvisoli]
MRNKTYPGWLFFFRVNMAGFALLHFLAIQPDFDMLYSYKGYIYPDIMDTATDHFSPTLISLQHYVGMPYETLLMICRIAYPLALVSLLLGCCTRLSAILSLFLQLLMLKSIHLYEYGVDGYTTIALFYCCIFPVGYIYSIDNRLRRFIIAPEYGPWLLLLRAHLCIAYFFSGFDKVIGVSWRNGEALWKTLHSHNYYSLFSMDFLVHTPFFLVAGWGTILLEMGYCIGMNIPKVRMWWLGGIVCLHLFIALFMGLFFFSAMMILLNLCAYYTPYIDPERFRKK